jgi:AAA+ superfamily predicted ATPase
MELSVEVDSRENCSCLLSPTDFEKLSRPFVSIGDSRKVVHCSPENEVKRGTVMLSREFAACLGLEPGGIIMFTEVRDFPIKQSSPIIVSAASIDDWEVIESQAVFLEANILPQIKVLSQGMIFPVWVRRGQKPVKLRVTGDLTGGYQLLSPDMEIAVEARARKPVALNESERRKYLPVRVVDTGFPSIRENPNLLGVGMIANTKDFVNAFGADSGCMVTVRDRPDILTIVACDASLADSGVALISPFLREMYQLVAGERVVIEQQSKNFTSDLIVPKRLTIGFPPSVPERKRHNLFTDFIEKASAFVVPQGGYIDINVDGESSIFVQVNFSTVPSEIPTSKAAAVITAKQLKQTIVVCSDLPPVSHTREAPRPYLKYVPDTVTEDAKKYDIISAKIPNKIDPLIPSFCPIVERIRAYIDSAFVNADIELPFVGSVVLIGPSAKSGRTTVVYRAIEDLNPRIPVLRVDCASLADSNRYKFAEVLRALEGLVRYAFETPPMILFLDDVDLLFSDQEEDRQSKRGEKFAEKFSDLLTMIQPNRSVVLVGTAVKDSVLLSKMFIHRERLPSQLTRADHDALVPSLTTVNYSLMELLEIRRTGKDNRELRRKLMAGTGVNKSLLGGSKPPSLGGLESQISSLFDAITLPLNFPFLFEGSRKSLMSSGAFVVGPSGTGKSALVDLVVRKADLPVEIVRGPDLLDKYIGASEQAVRKVFEKAASIAPCVLVFDGIEALCHRRGSESTGVTDRVVNQMLCYLDGIDKVEHVFVVAVSSRPDMVDPALTRPGRLDMVVVCDVPSMAEKEEIVKILWNDFVEGETLTEEMAKEISAMLHPNCTGADIKAGFVNAKISASRSQEPITQALVTICMQELKPSISDKEMMTYRSVLAKYKGEKAAGVDKAKIGTRVMLQ